jgi:hypothetical protein
MNKISHLYQMNALGFQFCVLPHVFVISGQHKPSTSYEKTFGKNKVNWIYLCDRVTVVGSYESPLVTSFVF